MNFEQASRALRKLYGKRWGYRYDESAPKAEEREEIGAALPGLAAALELARKAREARKAELLKDPEYVRLREAVELADKAHSKALSRWHQWRVVVGKSTGIFFEVTAQGDNWQDAIDKARAKAERK